VDERVSLCSVGSHDKQLSPTFSIRAEENFNYQSRVPICSVLMYNGFHRDRDNEMRLEVKK